jgi:hypothetical protein
MPIRPAAATHARIALWKRLPLPYRQLESVPTSPAGWLTNEILFLSHRMPFPPDRGDKIRSHHVLRIWPGSPRSTSRPLPMTIATLPRKSSLPRWRAVTGWCGGSSRWCWRGRIAAARRRSALPAFHSAELADYVARTLRERPIATIYVFSGQMGQYIPDVFSWPGDLRFRRRRFGQVRGLCRSAIAGCGAGSTPAKPALLMAEEARLARRAAHQPAGFGRRGGAVPRAPAGRGSGDLRRARAAQRDRQPPFRSRRSQAGTAH